MIKETIRRNQKRPTADLTMPNGSTVFWSAPDYRGTRNKLHVRIHCGLCHTDRWVLVTQTMHRIRVGSFNGACNPCFRKTRWLARCEPRAFGARHKTKAGYVVVYAPGHRQANRSHHVLEHRMVMSDALRRRLRRTEHVHHKNGRKDDNRPENLVLLRGNVHWLVTQLEQRIRLLETALADHGIMPPP